MSWDNPAYSFGNPDPQPPTPTQTPISGDFSSPAFQTPRANPGDFGENRGGWTPIFAEEYSVFHATPGRLTDVHHLSPVADISTPRLSTASNHSHSHYTNEDAEYQLAGQSTGFSPHGKLAFPPVDPSRQLSSSPDPAGASAHRSPGNGPAVTPLRPSRRLEEPFSAQTATPPQSSTGQRKIAPKTSTGNMQMQYGTGTLDKPMDFMAYPPNTGGSFAYTMSVPATAPVYTNQKPFWDSNVSMEGMDMDCGSQAWPDAHKMDNSFDWSRNAQIPQEAGNAPGYIQTAQPLSKQPRSLAPKPPASKPQHDLSQMSFEYDVNTSAAEDPFSMASSFVGVDPGVNPGLLFGLPPNPVVKTSAKRMGNPTNNKDSRPSSQTLREPYQHQKMEARREQEEAQRARAHQSNAVLRYNRAAFSSPTRSSHRPNAQRSVSDTRHRKIVHSRVVSADVHRPSSSSRDHHRSPSRGRSSPKKQVMARPSLSAIPESFIPPTTRTSVTFSIDENGRAHTETTLIVESQRTTKGGPEPATDSEELDSYRSDQSSSDDEPIMLPRTRRSMPSIPTSSGRLPQLASFPTSRNTAHERKQSTWSHSSSGSQSLSSHESGLQICNSDSEAETVIDDEMDDGSGDAANALRKLVQSRKQSVRAPGSASRHHLHALDTGRVEDEPPARRQRDRHGNYVYTSPTTITDPDLATPTGSDGTASSMGNSTRCVCNNPESQGFMIQCESCDKWQHAKCVKVDRRRLPAVWICAFCAQTPNMRGGRMRTDMGGGGGGGRGAYESLHSSPLARKLTQKSFGNLR